MGIIWETHVVSFLIITFILGGAAAYYTGRAVAQTWRPAAQLIVYTVGLTFAVRFIHFALFGGSLTSIQFAIVDFIVLFVIGAIGYRLKRVRQMAEQYPWLYDRQTPFTWRVKPEAGQ